MSTVLRLDTEVEDDNDDSSIGSVEAVSAGNSVRKSEIFQKLQDEVKLLGAVMEEEEEAEEDNDDDESSASSEEIPQVATRTRESVSASKMSRLKRTLGLLICRKKKVAEPTADDKPASSIKKSPKPQPLKRYKWSTECWIVPDSVAIHTLSFLKFSDVLKLKAVNKRLKHYSEKTIEFGYPGREEFCGKWGLVDAVNKYCSNKVDAIDEIASTYGYPINNWNVSRVEDFSAIFKQKKDFNSYIGGWDVSNAKCMKGIQMDDWDKRYTTIECNATLWQIHNWKVGHRIREGGLAAGENYQKLLEESFNEQIDRGRRNPLMNRWPWTA
ncbi:MAG: hypothetical protein SGILL_005862 [Bacillariaceae sp.]